MKKKTLIIIGSILIALGPLSFVTGVMYTLLLPLIYASTSIVQVEFPENEKQQYTKDALLALTRQKAELVKTKTIFDSVIEKHNLDETWGREGNPLPHEVTLKILYNSVESTADKKAVGLIRVTVRRDDPEEASEIANTLSSTFEQSQENVSVADVAQPNMRPVSPNLFMNVLFSLQQAMVIGGIGIVLLVLGIKKKKVQPVK